MGVLCKLFSINTVHRVFLPIFINLCRDNCSIVRKNTCKNLYKVISAIKEDKEVLNVLIVSILAFGNYDRFSLR